MIKTVTLDIWNTLLNIDKFYYKVAEYLAKISGESKKETVNLIRTGYREVRSMRRLGKFNDRLIVSQTLEALSHITGIKLDVLKRAFTETITSIDPQDIIIDGVISVLKELKALGLKLATVGNVIFWPGSYTRSLLERSGIAKYLDIQIYADEVGYSKPKKEIFYYALRSLGIDEPREALHVGDNLYEDFAGAILAHMRAILIDPTKNHIIEIANGEAYIIPNITYLPNVIKEIMNIKHKM